MIVDWSGRLEKSNLYGSTERYLLGVPSSEYLSLHNPTGLEPLVDVGGSPTVLRFLLLLMLRVIVMTYCTPVWLRNALLELEPAFPMYEEVFEVRSLNGV